MQDNMSRFDITHTQKDPDEWSQIAYQRVGQNNLQAHVFGGFLLAGTVAVMSTPITGALVVGYVLWTAIEKGRSQSRNFEALDKGCIAHVLDDSDFRAYARQVGPDKLNDELTYALQEDYKLSDTALEYLETSNPGLLNAPQKPFALPASIATNTDSNTAIAGLPDLTIDIVEAMTSPVQNCAIFGVGGSGKGMLVANALRRIKATNPNRKIFYIDPKSEPKEYGYLEGVVDEIRRKPCKNRPEQEICDWIDECLDEYLSWSATQEETLLVIDEGTVLGHAAKKCKNTRIGSHILHVSSLGGSAKEKVWLLAQSPYVGAMGLDLTTTSQIVNVCIISQDNSNVIKQWKKSSIMETIEQSALEELFKACPVPKTKRAIFWGGTSKWYAMPVLENYSSYNRDEDKPTGDALSTSDRASLRDATAVATAANPVDAVAQMVNKVARTKYNNLADFIKHDLKSDNTDEIKLAVVNTIRDRTDLLEKFNLGWLAIKDPIEALKLWASEPKTDEEIREAWLLKTQQRLNDQGVKHLREKLEN